MGASKPMHLCKKKSTGNPYWTIIIKKLSFLVDFPKEVALLRSLPKEHTPRNDSTTCWGPRARQLQVWNHTCGIGTGEMDLKKARSKELLREKPENNGKSEFEEIFKAVANYTDELCFTCFFGPY